MTQPNWADMLAGESLLAWLTRTDTDRDWAQDPESGVITARLGATGTEEAGFTLRPMFTEEWWQAERDRVLGVKHALPLPPVWTDLTHATMGETVALANGLDVAGPLSGVIVVITGHPPGAGVFGFGDQRSWGHAGACMFRTGEGAYEWPISLGPQTQIITPRSMQVSEGARFRVGSGYEGTVTPWLASGG